MWGTVGGCITNCEFWHARVVRGSVRAFEDAGNSTRTRRLRLVCIRACPATTSNDRAAMLEPSRLARGSPILDGRTCNHASALTKRYGRARGRRPFLRVAARRDLWVSRAERGGQNNDDWYVARPRSPDVRISLDPRSRRRARAPGPRATSGIHRRDARLLSYLSGRRNLEVFAATSGLDARSAAIDARLERVGLTDRAGDPVSSYSLGMRQRLGLHRRCSPIPMSSSSTSRRTGSIQRERLRCGT